MKKVFRHTYQLVLLLTLGLILADCGFIGTTFSDLPVKCPVENTDSSGNSGHSHPVGFEDEVFLCDSKVKATAYLGTVELIRTLSDQFKSCSVTTIWQPPKFS